MNNQYRKKPVIIEAYQIIDSDVTRNDMPNWIIGACMMEKLRAFEDHWSVRTPEGTMRGKYGDYIIRGVKGEIYPCDREIFHQTYEKVIE